MVNSPFQKLDLSGRVLTITGGGGGLGREAALLTSLRGASVVVADIDQDAGLETVSQVAKNGGQAVFVRVDVSNEADAQHLVEFAVAEFGGLHGAFNNAGIGASQFSIVDMPVETWQRSLDVNLTGMFLCMKHQINHMLAHGGGAIVNTSSTAGICGFAKGSAYCATKHGIIGLTRAAALEVADRNIRINAILPGSVNTPMLDDAFKTAGFREYVETSHPIGRLGTAAEIAETVAWLLSDASSFATAANFIVDGGFSAP